MKISIIYNPAAGGAHLKRLSLLTTELRLLKHELAIYHTRRSGEATLLARQALKEGAEVILAVGGDGTVNEVIQTMAGTQIPLAVYPAGTTNVWCQQMRMPRHPRRAARVITAGPRRTVDLGRAGDRYFLLMTGIGLDGAIVHAVDLALKRRIGKMAYALAALPLLNSREANLTISLNPGLETAQELQVPASLAIITNAERYAVLRLASEARVDDGELDLLVFQAPALLSRMARAVSVLTRRIERDVKIIRYRLRSAIIRANPPVAAQVDGDPHGIVGEEGLEIKCVPGALRVIVPEDAPGYLFTVSPLTK